MYICGGFTGRRNLSDAYVYHFKQAKWERLADLNPSGGGLRGQTATTLPLKIATGERREVMALHGGRDKDGPSSVTHLYDFQTKQWLVLSSPHDPSVPTERYFHGAVANRTELWLFGGLGFRHEIDKMEADFKAKKPRNLRDFYVFAYGPQRHRFSGMNLALGANNVDFVTALPVEISTFFILTKLDTKDLFTLATVCKAWCQILNEDIFWKPIYLSTLQKKTVPASTHGFKQLLGAAMKERRDLFKDFVAGTRAPMPVKGTPWGNKPTTRPREELDLRDFAVIKDDVKLAVLGAGGVGKSALTIQFVYQQFVNEFDPTIENSYRKQVSLDKTTLYVDILDTAGPEEFCSLRNHYSRSGEGFIITYSISSRSSFDELDQYVDQLIRMKEVDKASDLSVVICGNKKDLEDDREVSFEEGQNYAKRLELPFIETSALTAHLVDNLFAGAIRSVLQKKCRDIVSVPTEKKRCVMQ
eukprot:TRINITY_DN1703_c0_g1_i1.p1 TRINITY_DN1703_c0_g1~~TRINITY_DN1703_c0_g1_i1.p1  ORF type:complete len:499 (+),score=75.33 TRINITY_DN1703_c0_g1_i1:84-1499(+)